ncbi:MAG TPA: hypothetical protein VLF90_02185 [Patescibacteria group bacterium]|nr:hypothetical protein [Patescibacteria group bacterium]
MYPEEPTNAKQKTLAAITIGIAVFLVTIGVKAYNEKQKPTSSSNNITSTQTPTTITSKPSSTSPTSSSSPSSFKDGTYTASVDYFVPPGQETIQINLTIKGGIVTGSSVQNSENNPTSAQFQQDFAAEYKSMVVGKNINGLRLFSVAGASDTTQGFNNAVQQIQNQAAV